jgi:hypothetical protein
MVRGLDNDVRIVPLKFSAQLHEPPTKLSVAAKRDKHFLRACCPRSSGTVQAWPRRRRRLGVRRRS